MAVTSGFVTLSDNFEVLAISRNLRPGSKAYRNARSRFIVNEFDEYFGEDTKLQNWQRLCTDLGIPGPPQSITQCRKVCWQKKANPLLIDHKADA
jgi:hypothetical protein